MRSSSLVSCVISSMCVSVCSHVCVESTRHERMSARNPQAMERELATFEQQIRQQQAAAAALTLESERSERAARDAFNETQELRQTMQHLQHQLSEVDSSRAALEQELMQARHAIQTRQEGADSATQTVMDDGSEVANLRAQLAGSDEVIRILKEGKARLTGDLACLERLARQAEHEVTRLRHKLHQSGYVNSPQSATAGTPTSFLGSEADPEERQRAIDSSLLASPSHPSRLSPPDFSHADKQSGVVWARVENAGDEWEEEQADGGVVAEIRRMAALKAEMGRIAAPRAPSQDSAEDDQDGELFYSPRSDDPNALVPPTSRLARADSGEWEIAQGDKADARQRALERSPSPQVGWWDGGGGWVHVHAYMHVHRLMKAYICEILCMSE